MQKPYQLLGWAISVFIASANPRTVGLAVLSPAGQGQDSVASAAQPAGNTSAPPHYSRKQLSALRRDAKTVEHHEHLARYFRLQEREFLKKETYQLGLLADYLTDPRRYPSKYPTRGDSAKSLAAHYHLQADKAAGLAREHERQAAQLRAKSEAH